MDRLRGFIDQGLRLVAADDRIHAARRAHVEFGSERAWRIFTAAKGMARARDRIEARAHDDDTNDQRRERARRLAVDRKSVVEGKSGAVSESLSSRSIPQK